jgi:hypothetical protein
MSFIVGLDVSAGNNVRFVEKEGKDTSKEVYITNEILVEFSTAVLVAENKTDLEELLLLIFALRWPIGEWR